MAKSSESESLPLRTSQRAHRIEPCYVLEVAKAADERGHKWAHTDQPKIFLNIGEHDYTAPPLVQQAAERAIRDGRMTVAESQALKRFYEGELNGYAYLE